jgi:hypothetical protein
MPKAMDDIEGFHFFFYSEENDEPLHVHVTKGGADAKFWISGEIQLAWNEGFKPPQLRRILQLIEEHQNAIREAWRTHFRAGY